MNVILVFLGLQITHLPNAHICLSNDGKMQSIMAARPWVLWRGPVAP